MGIEHVAQPQQKEKINNKRAMPRGHCTQFVLCRLVYSSLVDITIYCIPILNGALCPSRYQYKGWSAKPFGTCIWVAIVYLQSWTPSLLQQSCL